MVETKERSLSISQLRTFNRCPKSYELQYINRTPVLSMGASVWFGKTIQQIIQRAYHDIPLLSGHLQVWNLACGPIFEALQDWFALDHEYRASGAANSRARKDWIATHPEYKQLTIRIDAYQQEYLSDWNWSQKYPLTAYYRWSTHLAINTRMTQIIVPHATLVEGLPVRAPDGSVISHFEEGTDHYRLLRGVIGGAPVVGVPDQFGVDPDGVAWISDNKVTAAPLTADELGLDMQLAAYYLLLRQNGWIAEGQPTRVGHCYIKENELPRHEWSDISRYADLVLPQLHDHFAQLKAALASGKFLRVSGLQPSAFSPCKFCGVRSACLEEVRSLQTER